MIELLQADDVPVEGAVWTFDSEGGGWRLNLALGREPDEGIFRRTHRLRLSGEDVPDPTEVRSVDASDPVVAGTSWARTSPLSAETQLGQMMLGRRFFEDAYVYRSDA